MAGKIEIDARTLVRWAEELDEALKAITHIRTKPNWWQDRKESSDRVIEHIATCLRASTWHKDHKQEQPVQVHMGHGVENS